MNEYNLRRFIGWFMTVLAFILMFSDGPAATAPISGTIMSSGCLIAGAIFTLGNK